MQATASPCAGGQVRSADPDAPEVGHTWPTYPCMSCSQLHTRVLCGANGLFCALCVCGADGRSRPVLFSHGLCTCDGAFSTHSLYYIIISVLCRVKGRADGCALCHVHCEELRSVRNLLPCKHALATATSTREHTTIKCLHWAGLLACALLRA